MINVYYPLHLQLAGPIISAATDTTAFALDTSTRHWQHKAVLGATLIKGNIRHELTRIISNYPAVKTSLTADHVSRWFGPIDHKGFDPHNDPKPANIDFGYVFTLTESLKKNGQGEWLPMTMPEVNPMAAPNSPTTKEKSRYRFRAPQGENGRVADKMLLKAQDYFGAGTRHTFSGTLHAKFEDDADKSGFEHWIGKSLQSIQALGAMRTIGFGELLSSTLGDARFYTENAITIDHSRIQLRFKFDRPLCTGTMRRANSNAIISTDAVPGSTLLAVLARRIRETGIDRSNFDFDRFHMSFAQPATPGGDPGYPKPLSLAYFGNNNNSLRDLCQHREAQLMPSAGTYHSPVFSSDWKPDQHNNPQVFSNEDYKPLEQPDRILSVRTAINQQTGAADEGRLFSMECIDTTTHEWVAELDLNQQDETQLAAAKQALQKILATPLDGIGKTRARATVSPCAAPPFPVRADGEQFTIVMLLTPCRMFSDESINGQQSFSVENAYREYWHQLGFKLSHYYTRQALEGGEHYYRHRLKKLKPQVAYQPVLLTLPGSVFALESPSDEPETEFGEYLRLGLPPLNRNASRNWQTDPFIRENGYGRIALNYPGHGSFDTVPISQLAEEST